MSHRFDLVTVGNYTKDTIVTKAGTRHVHGGGFNYAAHAAKVSGLDTGAVTRLAEDLPVLFLPTPHTLVVWKDTLSGPPASFKALLSFLYAPEQWYFHG